MSFVAENTDYETWLGTQCAVVKRDVKKKHDRMCESPFMFLRATYFRWAKQTPVLFPDLMNTPAVLSVGDLHSENFGTWRDEDGRLIWGVNDFDEASIIPYAFDLVRLATSVRLAASEQKTSHRNAATAIVRGYKLGLKNPRPTFLDARDRWLRHYTQVSPGERRKFWKKVAKYPAPKKPPPPMVAQELSSRLPGGAKIIRYATRSVGGGSLGRVRYVVIADWREGRVIREAKALVQSAWNWAHGNKPATLYFKQLATQNHRAPDPYLDVKGDFIYRRLAPDSRKIELDKVADFTLRRRVLIQMGFDVGAIHAADPNAAAIEPDLTQQDPDWLYDSAKIAAAAVERDYQEWCRHQRC
ncbi:MAG: hypothetical protein QOC72_3566 [Methylobacteriaceae bacterium]|jgi:hypothetical protein|nr:hypothetical protein [Methylobacteriaceae bacterium]